MAENFLEIACFHANHVAQITKSGANRIELCADHALDGITPSADSILYARKNTGLPLYVMIRPRGGNFVYSSEEIDLMLRDIRFAKDAGINGIVTGILTRDGNIDRENIQKMMEAAGDIDITFHRAFDAAFDPFKAFDDLISLGIKRVLTSGQAPTALQGIELLHELCMRSNARISIMAGAKVDADAIPLLYEAGIREFHASAFTVNQHGGMDCHEEKIIAMKKAIHEVENH